MTEDLDRAVVEARGNVAASGKGGGQLIDRLLLLIFQTCGLAAEQGVHDLGRDGQLDRDAVMGVYRKLRVPFAENDADGDLPLALGERVIRWMKMVRQRRHRCGEGGIVDPDFRGAL